jgi:hypothetical protein
VLPPDTDTRVCFVALSTMGPVMRPHRRRLHHIDHQPTSVRTAKETSRPPLPSETLAMPLSPPLPSTTNPLLLCLPHSKPSPHMTPPHYPSTPNLHYHHQKSTPSPFAYRGPVSLRHGVKRKQRGREVRSVERERRTWGQEGPTDEKWV